MPGREVRCVALAMHGRTREQMYTGTVDLETLTKVAGSLTKIPFIANGDIRNVEDARQRIEEVGADAVMVGRTAMGNPYIFNQINHYLETGEVLPDLSFDDKLNVAFDHLTRLTNLKGESIAVREFRGLALTTSVAQLVQPRSVEPLPEQRLSSRSKNSLTKREKPIKNGLLNKINWQVKTR